ncbi:class I mannose-6-phosphate isomerase [Leptospira bandrabouensis]|uniref:type I phosphomannose isomerase catalytic subunit n=1 Tax=Leptospira bandrabouensis TaxID=2484903 RepID=UPI00223E7741|nr:type I phosphomannose isomerase catalytic subunit [Leptospira bandrabouensis]MCW7456934.1 class I mannose-6-phosphate isomerase [Leptospira bandrabouensis]MCW7475880.1 class I mannose-6-phosphate isomerase [Leptospira bandrabouensis]MCW7483562.1 class I mannose-6-phosphate isomerase [Leptospira bandrabouensis]
MEKIPQVLFVNPLYKEKIWGGRKLETSLGRKIPDGSIGESWEVSVYGSDISPIKNKEFENTPLTELIRKAPDQVLGKPFAKSGLPLLVKVIDAKEKLSVQVHPDDDYALKYDPKSNGKKECWYVLSADPGAELVVGFDTHTNREEYETLVKQNLGETVLRKWKVKPGDVFLLNPGTIHAIGGGVLLLEVQQSSDSTYRVYDYGRLGDDGNPRELHLEKALAVLNFQKSDGLEKQIKQLITYHPFPRYLFTSNDKFRLESWEFNQAQNFTFSKLGDPVTFGIFYTISGSIYFPEFQKLVGPNETFMVTASGFLETISAYAETGTKLAFMSAGSDTVKYQSLPY